MSRHKHNFFLDYTSEVPVARWKSNNSVPPADCLEEMFADGEITDYEFAISNEVRAIETQNFLREYRKRMETYKPSAEELYEMKAAFGAGARVVDVCTGVVTVLER